MSLAPIAFFAYKRPEHTLRSLESLSQNLGADQSDLFIFCDAPKHLEDREQVNRVRQVVRSQQWCKSVHIVEQLQNLGLANSIVRGVTELCEQYGRVIVVEDDLVLSPYFLSYMNTALDRYADEPKVMQISGYMFPVTLQANTDAIFLPFPASWGWATWKRAWDYFDPEAKGISQLVNNEFLKFKFNLDGSYPYFPMLERQVEGKIDSWAIRWYLSTFFLDALTLYPTQSQVKNIGFDGTGVHCDKNDWLNTIPSNSMLTSFPQIICVDLVAKDSIFDFLRTGKKNKKMIFDRFYRDLSTA